MKPVFCGNFEYDAREGDLERLFRKYGRVERVDMKAGFAFVYMEDERDAEDAIRALDRIEFGRKGRRLRVEWTKGERGGDRRSGGGGGSRRSSSLRPSKTLFVINFDADNTRTRDLERHFEPYGKIVNVRIRRNFAFVQYEEQEDATRALEATNNSKLMDKVISVEYAMKDDDARGNGHSPERRRDRSPERRRRSPSPYKRERGSPDYGRGGSPVAAYKRERTSPDYGRRRSPSPYKRTRRSSPEYGRDHRHRGNESPRRRERAASPRYSRSPDNKRERASPDRSPFKKESLKNGDGEVDSPRRERSRSSPENGQVESPGSIGRRDSDGGYDGADSPPMQKSRSRSPPAEE
ncbi:Serine/arginine-rich splicing factor RS40 [Raphanus sativus]|uniref:Serine/arginine-rich splicing factor RS40 isoform X1 n=2 Tax=Raphanus sativus TaxID=3726 RepID=A0A6J0KUG3_RAPSA|nr:serine/arginine-rich splicing factor RS40 isoform X1 [Raphanus sativus]KAJ4880376.1 Serine/arginine-rich splicing factor RS40 [Raphanus sativus]